MRIFLLLEFSSVNLFSKFYCDVCYITVSFNLRWISKESIRKNLFRVDVMSLECYFRETPSNPLSLTPSKESYLMRFKTKHQRKMSRETFT
jgi:hypothetical protein